jgi:hypothetical protein
MSITPRAKWGAGKAKAAASASAERADEPPSGNIGGEDLHGEDWHGAERADQPPCDNIGGEDWHGEDSQEGWDWHEFDGRAKVDAEEWGGEDWQGDNFVGCDEPGGFFESMEYLAGENHGSMAEATTAMKTPTPLEPKPLTPTEQQAIAASLKPIDTEEQMRRHKPKAKSKAKSKAAGKAKSKSKKASFRQTTKGKNKTTNTLKRPAAPASDQYPLVWDTVETNNGSVSGLVIPSGMPSHALPTNGRGRTSYTLLSYKERPLHRSFIGDPPPYIYIYIYIKIHIHKQRTCKAVRQSCMIWPIEL